MSVGLKVPRQSFRMRKARFDACHAALERWEPEVAGLPDLQAALRALGWGLHLGPHGDAEAVETILEKLRHELKLFVVLGYFAEDGSFVDMAFDGERRASWRFDGARSRLVREDAPEPRWNPVDAQEAEEQNVRRVRNWIEPSCPTCAGRGEGRVEMNPDEHGYEDDFEPCPGFRCRACRAWMPNPLEIQRIRAECATLGSLPPPFSARHRDRWRAWTIR